MSATGRDLMLEPASMATSTTYPGGWREGTTIPGEYYLDEKHYLNDERFIGEHFRLLADHENRIPKPGDYFVFEYGRGESLIFLRNRAGAVKAYHNVCGEGRHAHDVCDWSGPITREARCHHSNNALLVLERRRLISGRLG